MFKEFNKNFYRNWEFYLFLLCLLKVIFATVKEFVGVMTLLQLALGLYGGYLAFFRPCSWIKQT